MAQGGETGNISVSRSRPAAGAAQARVVVAPAEGGTERAERAAEADFMRMEVTAFEPHAPEVAEHGAHGAVGGDAPSAGGGAQIAGDSGETGTKAARPPANDF